MLEDIFVSRKAVVIVGSNLPGDALNKQVEWNEELNKRAERLPEEITVMKNSRAKKVVK
ncbi:MAG: hypothetical protein ABR909_09185 [Candidatus Bathyarchaeia archaeon]